jgi:KaiC/GvpD/RAD55 family RecA-like ATPase
VRRLVDVRDPDRLSDALLQVLFFAEHVNSTAHSWILRHRTSLQPAGKTSLPYLRNILQQAQGSFHQIFNSSHPRQSDVITLSRRIDLVFRPDPDLIERLVRSMVDPFTAGAEQKISRLQSLKDRISIFSLPGGGLSFANRKLSDSADLYSYVSVLYWEEVLNPILLLQVFLVDVLKEDIHSADHYIQSWLRSLFDLPYRRDLKYTIGRICGLFNELFYSSPSPTHQQFHTKRSATTGISLLISEVARTLAEGLEPGEHVRNFPEDKANLKRALGIYLFFRFCRQLRCRYSWLDRQPDEARDLQEVDLATLHAAIDHRQCVSAIRPLQPTYFQTRMFGALSTIPGLNDIFRGGLLPRTSSGRTFTITGSFGSGKTVLALQMLCDVARQGRLAVYFSFEESYESIVDRLITFQFHDPDKFEIIAGGPGLAAKLRKAAQARPRRGILILYGGSEEERVANAEAQGRPSEGTYSLPAAIRRVADMAGDWKWRALAIDSINAMDFQAPPEEFGRRLLLQELIQVIETKKFLGLILSEQGNPEFEVLTYLSDTAMELGVNNETKNRWLQIKKCRAQDYQPGNHPFRIADGRGVVIYPSLSARMSSLRRRMRTTLSERWGIALPAKWREPLGDLQGLQEKSSTLIWGPAGAGKTALMLQLATSPSELLFDLNKRREPQGAERPEPPGNVLLVTFRTSEFNFLQSLRHHPHIFHRWRSIHRTRLRWYSPGDNITGDQIIAELWSYVHESRRAGLPIERILFDETEMAEDSLPSLKREPLFWPTLLELVSTEAITSFFISGDAKGSRVFDWLSSTVDYILHTWRDDSGEHWLEVEKNPELWMAPGTRKVEIRLDQKSGLIE